MMKVEEEWIRKEKMDDFEPNVEAQNDLFYLSNWLLLTDSKVINNYKGKGELYPLLIINKQKIRFNIFCSCSVLK